MRTKPITLELDLSKRPKRLDVVYTRQCEFNATELIAYITDFGEAVELVKYDCYLEIQHHDMTCVSIECDTDGNKAAVVINDLISAVEGEVMVAYFAIKTHDSDGLQTLCATTQDFAIRVLPDAAKEGCGITKAYSSEIVEMLRLCHERFTAAEAEREKRVNDFIDESQDRVDTAIEDAEQATDRANEAADKVEQAIDGTLSPLFQAYLESLKDVEGGFVSYDSFAASFMTDEEFVEYAMGEGDEDAEAGNSE